jgi:hypothetical protein
MFRDVIETQFAGRTVRLTPEQFAGLRARGHQIADGVHIHGQATYATPNELPMDVESILSRVEDAKWAWASAQWLPGNVTTRRFSTTAEARAAARDLLSERSARARNPNGVLVTPVGADRGHWVQGFDEREEG